MIFAFWLLFFLIFYATIGYPLLVLLISFLFPRRRLAHELTKLKVDFVIAAYNEADVIVEKVRNTMDQVNSVDHEVRVMIVSDGSEDETVERARAVENCAFEIIDLQPRQGKVNALNYTLDRLSGDVVVFSDANAMLKPGALFALLSHYTDPQVGGVCGAIQIENTSGGGLAASESLYWRYDQAVKEAESSLGGAVSAQGTFHSVRREHVAPLPPDAADDFTISVRAVDGGSRLVFEPKAVAIERVTESAAKEFKRRVRSTERGWRALMSYAHLLNPFQTGFYAFKLFSHKFLRRLVPFLLVLLCLTNFFLLSEGVFYQIFFATQASVIVAALLGLVFPNLRSIFGIRHATFGLMTLAAMALGIINYYRGKRSTIWNPARDQSG